VPADFAGDLLLWTAWLYHVEGLTQNDIAEELEVQPPDSRKLPE